MVVSSVTVNVRSLPFTMIVSVFLSPSTFFTVPSIPPLISGLSDFFVSWAPAETDRRCRSKPQKSTHMTHHDVTPQRESRIDHPRPPGEGRYLPSWEVSLGDFLASWSAECDPV